MQSLCISGSVDNIFQKYIISDAIYYTTLCTLTFVLLFHNSFYYFLYVLFLQC